VAALLRLQGRIDALGTFISFTFIILSLGSSSWSSSWQAYQVPLERFPVFKRKGSIIPLHVFDSITGNALPSSVTNAHARTHARTLTRTHAHDDGEPGPWLDHQATETSAPLAS
jgi:alpha-glucosidase (family GH31 glycosyl hydrolase)